MKHTLLICATAALLAIPSITRAEDSAPQKGKKLHVLSVGNSFSQNAHKYLRQIVKASGNDISLCNAYIGGCSFARHMKHANTYEQDPTNTNGTPYAGKSLKQLLVKEPWDVITIQQCSPESFKAESFDSAKELITYIRKYAPKSEIVVHQTWAYRPDRTNFWAKSGIDEKIMYTRLKANYDNLARENGFRQILGGTAFETAKLDPDWGPYNPETKTRSLFNDDCYHANYAGEYLLGCVWFETLYGQSCVGNTFRPKEMTKEDAATLQKVAHNTLLAAPAK